MSWESTLLYYRLVNEGVKARLGGLHSAQLVLYSVDFHDIERMMAAERWAEVGARLAEAAAALRRGGADLLILCTNTMHRVAAEIEAGAGLPLLHIADPTALAVKRHGLRRVGLLGTRFTMEQPFYRDRLAERHGLEVLVPGSTDREHVHRIIFEELCLGRVLEASRLELRRVIAELAREGAEAVILGCTELTLLVAAGSVDLPIFDTTALHAEAAVELALAP